MFTEYSEQMQRPILDVLYSSAEKHARLSNGLLIAIEPNLELYPHQSLGMGIVKSETAAVDTLVPLASMIRPRYQDISASLADAEDADTDEALDLMGTVLDSGQDAVLAFEHGEDVVTFIMNSLAVTNKLRSDGHEFRSAIIASKMLDFLAVDIGNFGEYRKIAEKLMNDAGVTIEKSGLVYARNILARAFEIQYLTVPNTQSTEDFRKRHGIFIGQYNKHIRREIKAAQHQRLLRKPPILLNAATPGTINKDLDAKTYGRLHRSAGMYDVIRADGANNSDISDAEVVGWIAPGVTTFTGSAITFAAAAKMNTSTPFLRIDRKPIVLKDEHSTRILGRKQVTLLDKAEPNRLHIYDAKGNLPLKSSGTEDLE